jgi:hypothetical protein
MPIKMDTIKDTMKRIVFALLSVCAASALAATLSFSDPNCAAFSLSGSTLTCIASGAPVPPTPVAPQVAVVPAPTPAPIGIVCAGFANTQVLDLSWDNPSITAKASGLGQSDAVVIRITTGPAGGYAKISGAEYGGISASRYAVLSTTPCDFGYPPPLGWGATSIGSTVEVLFSNGPNVAGYPAVPASTTFYFNLKTTGACGTSCSMLFQLNRY